MEYAPHLRAPVQEQLEEELAQDHIAQQHTPLGAREATRVRILLQQSDFRQCNRILVKPSLSQTRQVDL